MIKINEKNEAPIKPAQKNQDDRSKTMKVINFNDLGELKFLLKHSSVYGFGIVIGHFISFLLLPLYTRYLTPADYGVMALVDLVRWVIGLIISLGVIDSIARFYYEYQDLKTRNTVISSAYWITVVLIIVSYPILHYISPFLSSLVFHTMEYSKIFYIALLALLFGLLTDIGISYLRIRALSVKYVKINLVRMVFTIICNIFFVVYLETGIIGIFYANLLSSIVFSLFLALIVLKETGFGFSIHISKEMICFSFPLIFSSISRGIVNESDKLFINYFFSPIETGLYTIAQKFGTAIHSLITSPFLQAYLPRRFEIMKNAEAKQEYSKILTYYSIAICSIGLLVSMFSTEILLVMTTEQYHDAAKFIPAIVLSMIIFGFKYHFDIGMVIEKKTKYIAYINITSMLVNISLNWLLIKRFGIVGAIVSMNCSYLTTDLLSLFFSQKLFPIPFDYIRIFLIFGFSLFIFTLSFLISIDNLIISISLKVLLYVLFIILLLVSRIIPQEIYQKIKLAVLSKI